MKASWYSPMPPDKSGVAVYSEELTRHFDNITVNINPQHHESSSINVYSLGNHPLHDRIYSMMLECPGIVLIHDLNIHDLIYYRTAGRGKYTEYLNYLLNEGDMDKYDIAHLLYTDFPEKYHYFRKYNLIRETALQNNYFVVHTEHAKRAILSVNENANILRVNHFSVWSQDIKRETDKHDLTIGIFGYISENRHIDEIMDVFEGFLCNAEKQYSIIIAGTDLNDIAEKTIQERGLSSSVKMIHYPSDDEFLNIMRHVDYGINIRYPHNGEVSGNMIKMMGFGIPVAANETDAHFPENTYFSVDISDIRESLKAFFNTMDNDPVKLHEIGQNAFHYIKEQCNVQFIAQQMEAFIQSYRHEPVHTLKKFEKQKLMPYFSLRDRMKILIGRKG